jgi:hypothetical protein
VKYPEVAESRTETKSKVDQEVRGHNRKKDEMEK